MPGLLGRADPADVRHRLAERLAVAGEPAR
jgi:hypothetical protein